MHSVPLVPRIPVFVSPQRIRHNPPVIDCFLLRWVSKMGSRTFASHLLITFHLQAQLPAWRRTAGCSLPPCVHRTSKRNDAPEWLPLSPEIPQIKAMQPFRHKSVCRQKFKLVDVFSFLFFFFPSSPLKTLFTSKGSIFLLSEVPVWSFTQNTKQPNATLSRLSPLLSERD